LLSIRIALTVACLILLVPPAGAQSVKLPDWNSASQATPGSYFFQPLDGLSMFEGDGALFLCLEMPRGETKTQHGKHGYVTYLMGTHWKVNVNDRFNLYFQPQANHFGFNGHGGGTKIDLHTEPLPRDHGVIDETGVLVILQRVGDELSIRAVSCRDGRVYAGQSVDAASYELSNVRGGSGFAVGTVAENPKDAERDRGKGHQGNLEFVGYTTQTIDDATASRIALGADPVEVLGEPTLRWYRHFDGAQQKDQLPPTTSADTTRPSRVVGGQFMKQGATIRRQSPQKYLTLDYILDGYVWGLDLAQRDSQTATFRSGHGGLPEGSAIELRLIAADDGAVVVDWTKIAETGADGRWEGSIDLPRSNGWNHVEIRSAAAPHLVFRSRSRCAVGYKIAMVGQSEMSYFLRGYGGGMSYRPEDGAYSMVTLATENPNNTAHSHERPQIFVAEPWDKLSDGVLATVRQLREYTGTPICIVALCKSGTGATELADDHRNKKRRWVDLDAKVRLAGRDFSMMVWMWHASDRGYGERYDTGIFDPIVLGIRHEPKHEAYEHYIYDGTFDSQMVFCPMLHWGVGCRRTPYDGQQEIAVDRGLQSTMACMRGQRNWRQANAAGNPKVPHFPPVPQDDFPAANDIQGDNYHGGHADTKSPIGPRRIGYRMGEYLARVLDLSDSRNPRMQEAWFGEDRSHIYVRFSLPNGGILKTGGADTVTDIWVNAKGEHDTWVMSEHTARIVDPARGLVKLTRHEGRWPEDAQVAYAINRVALENVEGYLYEGSASGEAEGVLAMEDGLGIPVESYLPNQYETGLITVHPQRPNH